MLSSTIIDLTVTKAHVVLLVSLPVAICWSKFLHYFGSEMAANLNFNEIVNFSG